MTRQTRNRQPLLDIKNVNNFLTTKEMRAKKTIVELPRRSARARRSTEWKRREPAVSTAAKKLPAKEKKQVTIKLTQKNTIVNSNTPKIYKRESTRKSANKVKKALEVSLKNNSESIKKSSPKVSKRIASKNALTKIVKALSVSIERNSDVEELLKKKLKKKTDDIYEFTFDSDEEPKIIKKKGRKQKLIDDSGDENNSMKDVVQKIRRLEQKQNKIVRKKKINNVNLVLKNKGKENITKKKNVTINKIVEGKSVKAIKTNNKENIIAKKDENISIEKALDKSKLDNSKVPETLQEKICLSFEDNNDDNYDNDSPCEFYDEINKNSSPEKHQKTTTEEICDSFMNDIVKYDDTSTHLSPSNLLSDDIMKNLNVLKRKSSKINIISNVLVDSTEKLYISPLKQREIFNSTMNSVLETSNPWRLNISNIRNAHTFTVKDKSFIPNYDQEIVINSTLTDKISNTKENRPTPKKFKEIPKNKYTYQSSILNFVSGSKETKTEVIKSGGIFESPRKILGEINFMQSTPFHANTQQKIKSPNFSIIDSDEKLRGGEKNTLFGFSYDENSENIDPQSILKKKVIKKTPKKEKIRAVLFNDIIEVRNIEETNKIPEPDIQLFQDIDNDKEKLEVKKSRRSYERTKRKRLPSENSESDNESVKEVKIKYKNKRTKKEEQEVERLALHYNTMFEEIEKYDLCID